MTSIEGKGAAQARVARRADLRRQAAEHAHATISREWLEHYARQFLQPHRDEAGN